SRMPTPRATTQLPHRAYSSTPPATARSCLPSRALPSGLRRRPQLIPILRGSKLRYAPLCASCGRTYWNVSCRRGQSSRLLLYLRRGHGGVGRSANRLALQLRPAFLAVGEALFSGFRPAPFDLLPAARSYWSARDSSRRVVERRGPGHPVSCRLPTQPSASIR